MHDGLIPYLKKLAVAASIRAIKTMCQTATATIGVGIIGILDIDWVAVCSVSLGSGVLSLLTSVAAGLPEVPLPEPPEKDGDE